MIKNPRLIVTTQTTIMVISIAKQIKNRVNQNQLTLSHARLARLTKNAFKQNAADSPSKVVVFSLKK